MITSIAKSEEFANILNNRKEKCFGGSNRRLAIMLGMLDKESKIRANIPRKDRSQFSQEKYSFMLESKFEISNKCCNVMKKNPAHEYHKRTHRNPITATMASESKLRTQKWIQNGCNGFNLKIPTSNPMSFWTEQDILLYISLYGKEMRNAYYRFNMADSSENGAICSVYGDVVIDYDKEGNVDGQMDISELSSEFGLFEKQNRPLKTTGCNRTGCVLCGFGCHMPNDTRFLQLKKTHPGFHNLLNVAKNNGVTYAEAIDWVNEHGGFNIKY